MRSYKIKKVFYNNRRKVIEVESAKGRFSLPYSKLMNKPTKINPIEDLYIDKDLASTGITYVLKDGTEDSVPFDAFLDFNKDPDYVREIELYNLTVKTNSLVKKSGMSKREICRRMNTSMSQLSRLLDVTNYSKTFDQLIKLNTILGVEVKIDVLEEVV